MVIAVGLRILWDLKKNGDERSGGRILDPHNGKIYKCFLALHEGEKKLKAHGYIGFYWGARNIGYAKTGTVLVIGQYPNTNWLSQD